MQPDIHPKLPPLSRGHFDRRADLRLNSEALEAARRQPETKFLLLSAEQMLVASVGGAALARLDFDSLTVILGSPAAEGARSESFLLGESGNGELIFLVTVEQLPVVDGARWISLRESSAQLSDEDLALFTTGLALARWHEGAAFSAHSGLPIIPQQGGWMRHHPETGEEVYPRTDPAVIVLITDKSDRVLLGSNLLWPENRYSLLAGFVEAGESLESAVHREVFEEAGVRLKNVKYNSSQPWPFPRSLMLGFTAELEDDQAPEDLVPDETEIADLRWFTREELLGHNLTVQLPGEASIARFMINQWLNREGES